MQEVIIAILFLAAAIYIGRKMYKQYKAEDGCAAGCDSCAPTKKGFEIPKHLKG